MPWINRVSKHKCSDNMPSADKAYRELNANIGSIYMCDGPECDKRYILSESQKDGFYWRGLPGTSPSA